MKKTLGLAALAATIIGLVGITPAAQAATPSCNGVKASIVINTASTAYSSGQGSSLKDTIAVIGPNIGRPYIIYSGAGDDVVCNLSGGPVLIIAGDGNDTYYGNNQAATFYGGPGDDSAYGGSGIDTFYGGPGDEYLYGDSGNDTLVGNAGNDIVIGGPGQDIIIGSAGTDILSGTGNEQPDDKVADTMYGSTGEVMLKGSKDIVKTSPLDLTLYNTQSKKAFLAKYPTTKYLIFKDVKDVAGDSIITPNVQAYKKGSMLVGIWIAG